jgi:hypothetical protein
MAVTRIRKVLLVIVALAVLANFLPVTREEFAWWWAQSHDHAADYLRYLSNWPAGRHVVAARNLFEQRQRAELKRAQIRQAYLAASNVQSNTDAAFRRDQRLRRENFFWKKAATANTRESYNDYLREFPQGRYADQARQRIQALPQSATETNK